MKRAWMLVESSGDRETAAEFMREIILLSKAGIHIAKYDAKISNGCRTSSSHAEQIVLHVGDKDG
jgi:endo-beta-N-acetylglucosaminidase D